MYPTWLSVCQALRKLENCHRFSSWFQPRRLNCFDEIAPNATYEFSNVGLDIPVRGLIYNEVQENKTFPGKLRWLG